MTNNMDTLWKYFNITIFKNKCILYVILCTICYCNVILYLIVDNYDKIFLIANNKAKFMNTVHSVHLSEQCESKQLVYLQEI